MNKRSHSFVRCAIVVLAGISLGCVPLPAAPLDLPPLNTVSGNPRLPGKFIWADLVTDNALVAQKFYS